MATNNHSRAESPAVTSTKRELQRAMENAANELVLVIYLDHAESESSSTYAAHMTGALAELFKNTSKMMLTINMDGDSEHDNYQNLLEQVIFNEGNQVQLDSLEQFTFARVLRIVFPAV